MQGDGFVDAVVGDLTRRMVGSTQFGVLEISTNAAAPCICTDEARPKDSFSSVFGMEGHVSYFDCGFTEISIGQ